MVVHRNAFEKYVDKWSKAMAVIFVKLALALLMVMTALLLSSGIVPRARAQQVDGPDCAELIRDLTVPKGSIAYPGERFEKKWLVRNCGESEWIGYRAVNATGDNSFSIPDTAAKSEVEIVTEITAPTRPGSYVYVYGITRPVNDMRRMVRIGDQLIIEFIVAQVI